MLNALFQLAIILPALGGAPSYSRDAKDDKFVACAPTGQADYLVPFDEDLLVLRAVGAVQIVAPQQLLDLLNPP